MHDKNLQQMTINDMFSLFIIFYFIFVISIYSFQSDLWLRSKKTIMGPSYCESVFIII